jgi:fructose-1,6-bisphosphatase I
MDIVACLEIMASLEKCFIHISDLIRQTNSVKLGGLADINNASGDDVKTIDIMSNDIMKETLSKCALIRTIGSEEEDGFHSTKFTDAPYLICYDPLDGSSNIDVNITTGTIFSVYAYDKHGKIADGRSIVMSGYCLYGGATQYVLSFNNNLSFYQYSAQDKSFYLLKDRLKIKEKGAIYSLNESNKKAWTDARFNKIIDLFIEQKYGARWVGSLVADAHRTLIKGGFFAYPGNSKDREGKIRLLYEAYPFAHIFHTAGGFSSDGVKSILDVPFPDKIHQKTPIVLCGKYEHDLFVNMTA